ncbi:unnamed protein product [Paramecium primaurelia]|uniref:Cyclic nucleotide-binding domain-containing protein n=1 Tax=Paramecium primaurelia TaxID=5886 RepID=A0A8S1NF92_PARPR|nr:unnamed protein product [Paramecium primaurelia]
MSRRKTNTKEVHNDIDDEITSKELMYAPVIQIYKDYQNMTEMQIDSISGIMQNIEIFKTWCPETSTLFEFTRLISQNLQYEKYQKYNAVFNLGDQGDKFYIILTGTAAVYIKRQQQQIETEEQEILPKIQQYLDKMQLNSIQEIELESRYSFYEKLIKKQTKPLKQIESELLLLNTGNFDMYFTIYGICKFQQISQLHSGQYFGDMALTTDKPRAASIITITDIQVLTLNKSNFKKIFEKQIKSQQEKIEYFLKMFPSMTKFKISKLIMYFSQYKYPPNYKIWKQNDFVDGFFLLKEGEILLQKTIDFHPYLKQEQNQLIIEPKKEKTSQIDIVTLANLTDGCFIGETEIYLQNDKRDYTVKTVTQCNVYVLNLDNYLIIKRQFPEFINPLSLLSQKNLNLYKKRLNEIIQTKVLNLNFNKKEDNNVIERRYLNDIEINQQPKLIKSSKISSPILRSSIHPKMTKQQMVEQNQSIALQHSKNDKISNKQEEFNMLKMAGDNFQKCLLIRVEKQFEQFQPKKPKGKTPFFSKYQKDSKDLLDQIKRTFIPKETNNQYEETDQNSLPFLTMSKRQLRVISPQIQQKMEILKQCLSTPMTSHSKSVSQSVDQFYKIKAQQGFVLCDSLHPISDHGNTQSRFDKLFTNVKITSRNNKIIKQCWNSQKLSLDVIDTNFFSSQPTVQYI